ncbi:fimbrial protein [Paraburkholderia dinghuensis]|uniref:Type 1 fimbrial protein n=1 Tax=Paraburkholderia dinghuensis TaxID=2305225 RepID=A0A3N6N6K0_9BURK|nr:fimbrial protein [Paraburkholderia dinghuensis]RQH03597.1 type 1 fimbrial protein [Paraburkholderia dinghuensis]
MKKISRLSTAAAVVGLFAIAPAAQAYDGEITFNGMVTALTCTINNGTPDFTVQMPYVSTTSLAAEGNTAGRTPFSIALTDCTPTDAGHTVATFFEPGSTVNPATNQLFTARAGSNVELRLLNAGDYSKILAGAAAGSQNSAPFALDASGNATMNYYVEYVAVGGAATPGDASSSIFYTVTYQ